MGHLEDVEFAPPFVVDWFYNRRLFSSIGDVPPAEYEQRYRAQETPAFEAGLNQ